MSSPRSLARWRRDRPRLRRATRRDSVVAAGVERFVRGYVGGARGARRLADRSGLLGWLDRNRDRRGALFLRSLFAVHDIDDLGRLDLPWWTFAAIRKVDAFLAARGGAATAFEYGPGASTLWLARRCRRVVAVEHDPAWWPTLHRRVKGLANVDARLVPGTPAGPEDPAPQRSAQPGWTHLDFSAYVAAIAEAGGPFDLVVIDGRAREGCLRAAQAHLAPGGLIVFDNPNRRRYRAALQESGLHIERHRGFAPTVPWPSQTALLARMPPGDG
jgi:hypothetical protein